MSSRNSGTTSISRNVGYLTISVYDSHVTKVRQELTLVVLVKLEASCLKLTVRPVAACTDLVASNALSLVKTIGRRILG
jgi:hypothetical protein